MRLCMCTVVLGKPSVDTLEGKQGSAPGTYLAWMCVGDIADDDSDVARDATNPPEYM